MWRDAISEADLPQNFDLDVEMDDASTVDAADDDILLSDDTEEASEQDYAVRLRDRQQVNYAMNSTVESPIIDLDDDEGDDDEIGDFDDEIDDDANSEISSTTSDASESSENTFSANEIVGEPRMMAANTFGSNGSQRNSQIPSSVSTLITTTATTPLSSSQPRSSTQTHSNSQQNNDAINQHSTVENNDPNSNDNNNDAPKEDAKPNPLDESSGIVDSCVICCEPFTSTSEHRVVSLKCGHIFGKECIERWLKTKESKRRCPECNQQCNKNDVRIIYAKSIVAIDTSELDQAKKELDTERKMRFAYEQQIEELKFDLGLKESENIHLKREISMKEELIKRFKSSNSNQVETNLNQVKLNSLNKQPFTHLQTIDLKVEGCRMIVITEILGYIVISQPTSPNSLIKGFGVRRIPLTNFNSSDFIFLHTAQIKDMALHSVDALLLTASFDKQVKLVNLITKQIMATFILEAKPWCVTWNKNVVNLFYVGLNNGYLLEYSTTTNSVLKKINTCLGVPIKLIRYLNHNQSTNRVNLLITNIKTSFFCEIKSNHQSSTLNSNEEDSVVSMKPLPISGPIISTNIIGDNNSGNILLTVRPSNKYQNNIQHYVLDFSITGNNEIQYNLLNTYLGGYQSKHLITSKLFTHPDKIDSFLVCSGDEDSQGAIIWEKDKEKPIQKFFFKNVVFDIGLYKPHQSSEPILALLTERYLQLYKWTN